MQLLSNSSQQVNSHFVQLIKIECGRWQGVSRAGESNGGSGDNCN